MASPVEPFLVDCKIEKLHKYIIEYWYKFYPAGEKEKYRDSWDFILHQFLQSCIHTSKSIADNCMENSYLVAIFAETDD